MSDATSTFTAHCSAENFAHRTRSVTYVAAKSWGNCAIRRACPRLRSHAQTLNPLARVVLVGPVADFPCDTGARRCAGEILNSLPGCVHPSQQGVSLPGAVHTRSHSAETVQHLQAHALARSQHTCLGVVYLEAINETAAYPALRPRKGRQSYLC